MQLKGSQINKQSYTKKASSNKFCTSCALTESLNIKHGSSNTEGEKRRGKNV